MFLEIHGSRWKLVGGYRDGHRVKQGVSQTFTDVVVHYFRSATGSYDVASS